MEYPKQLYRSGWDDLADTIIVSDPDAEDDARQAGFRMLSDPDEQAEQAEDDAPEAPKRRGRPPKVAE